MNKLQEWSLDLKDKARTTSILLIVPGTVTLLNIMGIISGGLLGPAAVAGMVFTISFVFILLNLGMKTMISVRDFISSYAGWLDLGQTLLLTWLGFHLGGVILGLTFMYVGLNLSACFSLFRLWAVSVNADQNAQFKHEFALT